MSCGDCVGCPDELDRFVVQSLCDVQSACSQAGGPVEFVVRGEGEISRDDYGSIKEYQAALNRTYQVCAMDIQYAPSRNRLERSGLFLEAEVTITTPAKDWMDMGVEFGDIDVKRSTVRIGDETYKIREKGRTMVVKTTPLAYSFGLYKE